MRRFSLLLIIAALFVPLAGCGDDSSDSSSDSSSSSSSSADDAELDALVETLSGSDGPGISEKNARCVGEAVLPELSAKGKKSLDDGDLDELTDDERDVVAAAFNDCVPTTEIADALAKEISSGEDGLSEETAGCISDAVVEQYPKSGDLMVLMTSDDGEAALTSLITDCFPQDEIEQQLIDEFVSSGFTQEQAECIASGVAGQISTEDLIAAGEDAMSPEVQQVITEATQSCVATG